MDYVIITPENCQDIYGFYKYCCDLNSQYYNDLIKIEDFENEYYKYSFIKDLNLRYIYDLIKIEDFENKDEHNKYTDELFKNLSHLFWEPDYEDLINPLIFNDEPWLYIKDSSTALDYELFKQYNKIYYECDSIVIQDLPDNVTHFKCAYEYQIVNLPKNLLYLNFIGTLPPDYMSEKLLASKTILSRLPYTLLYLHAQFISPLINLPPNLEYLTAYIYDGFDFSYDYLPIGLIYLILSLHNWFNSPKDLVLDNFPPALEYFEINNKQNFSNLPDTIKYLIQGPQY